MNTIESISANNVEGYFEYIPWRSKTSPFWENKFLFWDADDSNGPGTYGAQVEQQIYFTGQPHGLWSICAAEGGKLGSPHGNAEVRGLARQPRQKTN